MPNDKVVSERSVSLANTRPVRWLGNKERGTQMDIWRDLVSESRWSGGEMTHWRRRWAHSASLSTRQTISSRQRSAADSKTTSETV